MATTALRIRQARAIKRVSQTALALQLGVHRSAVTQWESRHGTSPTIEHLVAIATMTGVCFEWLATGRGPSRPDPGQFDVAVVVGDFARDELETRALIGLRSVPSRKREAVVHFIEKLSA